MKFIEVHQNGSPLLINCDYIQMIRGSRIILKEEFTYQLTKNNKAKNMHKTEDVYDVDESYNKLKEMIWG